MVAVRMIFMGTAQLSCPILQALAGAPNFQLIAVVTQPDRPKGRHLKLQPSLVKELAVRLKLPVLQPARARDPDFIHSIRKLEPDLIAVAAYGQILPQELLNVPRFGCLNVHTSLLPKYRGASPIQRAILNDERETGVTIMKMDAGLDTGAILDQQSTPITPQDTSETLHDRLAEMGANLLVRSIPEFVAGKLQPCPQPNEGASYAPKIKKEEGHIDWQQSARTIWNRVRAFVPWPGAFTFLPGEGQGRLLKIWRGEVVESSGRPGEILEAAKEGIVVGCGERSLRILVLQREGGRRLTAEEFLTGFRLRPGQQLT